MKKISNYDIEELKIVKEEYTTACEEIINSIGIEDFEFLHLEEMVFICQKNV